MAPAAAVSATVLPHPAGARRPVATMAPRGPRGAAAERLSPRGHHVLAEFDLAAATSGGSLVLGGLLMDLTLEELFGLFLDREKRRGIFAAPGLRPARSAAGGKLAGLRAILGAWDRRLSEIGARPSKRGRRQPHLLICTFALSAQRGQLFRSDLKWRRRAPPR